MTKEKFSVIDGRLNMVVGFMFTPDRSRVVLIKKLRPTWQVGLLNGVGGRVREGEPPMQAMIREFEEETGVREENWESLCALKFKKGLIYFYYTFTVSFSFTDLRIFLNPSIISFPLVTAKVIQEVAYETPATTSSSSFFSLPSQRIFCYPWLPYFLVEFLMGSIW